MEALDLSSNELKGNVLQYLAHLLQNVNPYQFVAEAIMGLFIIYLVFAKSYKPKKKQEALTKEEEDQLIEEWVPLPLVPPVTEIMKQRNSEIPIVQSASSEKVVVNGQKCLNLMTNNFLGFVGNSLVEEVAIETIRKYGVGSCGPRGFYGSIDVHLHLEDRIAKFVGTEKAILYSANFATVVSVIAAFVKIGDVIVCDDGVTHAAQIGAKLSGSHVYYFKHNDMDDLERVLEIVKQKYPEDKKHKYRKFIVAEGLYYNYGDIAPLPKLMEFRDKYLHRLIIDESYSFGVLGKTGRGLCEHWGVPITSIDLITGGLGASFGSVGGFCCSDAVLASHQKLNSSGYVFSASSPPYLATAAIRTIDLLDQNPQLMAKLSIKAQNFRESIRDIVGLKVLGDDVSPVIHLRLKEPSGSRDADETILQSIVDKAFESGNLALTRAKYVKAEKFLPVPSIRVCISAAHDDDDLHAASIALKAAAAYVLHPPAQQPFPQQLVDGKKRK